MSCTKVKVLKTGTWAINPPNPGELHITEGEERNDIPDHLIKRMLHAGDEPCVKIIGKKERSPQESDDSPKAPNVLDDVSGIRATLMEIVDASDNKNDAKDKLEEWGREALGFEVDKRRSLDNVIADLITEHEEQNG